LNNKRFEVCPLRLRRAGVRLLQAAALALMVALAMPGIAAEARAVKSKAPPVYPEIARRMRISGEVKLSVTVSAEGNVTDVQPISGNRALTEAAEEAVRKWRFEPGGSVTTVEVSVNFAL